VTENVSANLQCIENYSVNEEPRQNINNDFGESQTKAGVQLDPQTEMKRWQ